MLLQARKLEAQLDEQMNSYRKLASSKGSTKVDSAENDPESGIDRLLKQLQQVNSQMQAWVSSGGSEMVSHTLTRHQEILQDLTQVQWPCSQSVSFCLWSSNILSFFI
jgi:Golgi SNAP receptor complex protein 1